MKKIDLSKIKRYSIKERKSKVSIKSFARAWSAGGTLCEFIDSLPDILCGKEIRHIIKTVVSVRSNNKPCIVAMGAHVIKVGLSPIIIDLVKRGIVTCLAVNGACLIHDFEVAFAGMTSEDVDSSLHCGTFGMAAETGRHICAIIDIAKKNDMGLGEAAGLYFHENRFPHADKSIFAAAHENRIPITVHVAMGTDIIHMHPGFDPAACGKASHKDFLKFTQEVSTLSSGIYFNIGSAVILPEVFLKAITLAANLGSRLDDITTVNIDFIRHYRPMTNVVQRPAANKGKGINITGHHEIVLPLLAAGIIEEWERLPSNPE